MSPFGQLLRKEKLMKLLFFGLITLIFVVSCSTPNILTLPSPARGIASVVNKQSDDNKSKTDNSGGQLTQQYLKMLFAKTGDFKNMSKGDCKAFASRNEFYCSTKDCAAILKGQSSLCESQDCKALIDDNVNLCTQNTCKALINDNQTNCDEKDKNCCTLFNPNLCETGECEGFLKNFQSKCTTAACNAIIKENMNECEP